jgi:hypothetical protein
MQGTKIFVYKIIARVKTSLVIFWPCYKSLTDGKQFTRPGYSRPSDSKNPESGVLIEPHPLSNRPIGSMNDDI